MSDLLMHALAMMQAGNPDGAYRCLVSAAYEEPENPLVFFHLGVALHQMRNWPAAAAAYSICDKFRPDTPETLTYLGWNLHLSGRTLEARQKLERAIELNPMSPAARTNYAMVLVTLKEEERALLEAKRGLDLGGTDPLTYMGLSFANFANGNWSEGFKNFEARTRFKPHEFPAPPMPTWQGQHVEKLFLLCEQGIGDSIMMWRYVREAARRVDDVILYCPKECRRLFEEEAPSNVQIVPMPRPYPTASAFIRMMSLPVALQIKDSEFHQYPQVYFGTQAKLRRLQDIDSGNRPTNQPFKVCLQWGGNPAHDADKWRSIDIEYLLPLLEVPNTRFYALQIGARQNDLGRLGLHGLITDLSGRNVDMFDSVDLLSEMDLVIAIDSSTAHIAGACGNQVFLLLNRMGLDWRYSDKKPTAFWYPYTQKFVKELDEGWEAVISRMAVELERLANHGTDSRHVPVQAAS